MRKGVRLIPVLLVIAIIIVAIVLFVKKRGNSEDIEDIIDVSNLEKASSEALEDAEIDVTDSAYEGSEFYQDGNDIIIKGPDGGITISKEENSENNEGMQETTEEDKEKYKISDVKVTAENEKTTITGKVFNGGQEAKNVIVNIKFYSEDNKIKGSASAKVTVGASGTQDFSMMIQDDVSNYKYETTVEYVS